ncbi:chromosome segregation protein SMC [Anaerotalea alkaliphila]|uniref:Chromosome partition protein Smc n=1 Tax=Anaerotalea alkaliphila TaxID=2662126 RepID=A0A7X5HUF3_9FIRM|nr:chromosome segregation protein SMC [Anaerotalea alkaliphila]NDL66867.1 chromosome segregation protein SMC [Anaerotalea alkaliphila]
MYLKNIDLYGFKSFANKMAFKFDKGITGIVGPNGSGKSNVADAVRWVLGEQSAKQLRGSKMEDVIFAGTDTRKPLGYCQVDLTLDNQDGKMAIDFKEVTVSRRVYRSGEGEYFINGSSCRLRDVHELFMDTGVGKEGYSIIGQGQIDKILSTKPDDRRALFDEAAGIVKFKTRRLEAEKKLETARQDLLRVEDILRTLEGQRVSLEGQAAKAKEFLALRQQLQEEETELFLQEMDAMEEALSQAKEKADILQADVDAVGRDKASLALRLEVLEEKLASVRLSHEGDREALTAARIGLEKADGAIVLVREQIKSLEQQGVHLERNLAEHRRQAEELEGAWEAAKEKRDRSHKDFQEKKGLLDEKAQAYGAAAVSLEEKERETERIKGDLIEGLKALTEVQGAIGRIGMQQGNLRDHLDLVLQKHTILAETLHSQEEEQKGQEALLESVEQRQKDCSNRKLKLFRAISEWENRNKVLGGLLNAKNRELQGLESKAKVLGDLMEHYDGYHFSIKKIMQQKDRDPLHGPGIRGVVADLLQVRPGHERAIETALGGNIQNIVTDNEETAKAWIGFLKHQQYGRATFLPMATIRPKDSPRPPGMEREPGFIGYGDALVSHDPAYGAVVRFLLGRILVVDTLDNAVRIGRGCPQSLRIITLDGEIVNPGGAMTGGAYKNNQSQFLGRKRELADLAAAMQGLQAEIRGLEEKQEYLLEKEAGDKAALESLKREEQELNLATNTQSLLLKQLSSALERNREQLADLEAEAVSIREQLAAHELSRAALEAQIQDGTQDQEMAESSVRQLAQELEELRRNMGDLQEAMTLQRVENSAASQELVHLEETLERLEGELSRSRDRAQAESRALEDNVRQRESRMLSEKSLEEEKAGLEVSIRELQKSTLEQGEEKSRLELEARGMREEMETLREREGNLAKEGMRLEGILERTRMQKENVASHYWEEYGLVHHQVKQQRGGRPPVSREEARRRADRFKSRIKQLGDVNVNAIQEFQDVQERFGFLQNQRNDLVEAVGILQGIIRDLDQKMRDRFKETFRQINRQFQEVFQELFGGGKALLELAGEEDVLESGILIHAQPPGKKLQNMLLLSGGERALTAIALLFAIQSLKPSPFCVLDEIEAALDDSNVDRFAAYLQKLSRETQFIIITHRKGTMEAADSLYGITMQEKGISTQVSVKFLKDMEDAGEPSRRTEEGD